MFQQLLLNTPTEVASQTLTAIMKHLTAQEQGVAPAILPAGSQSAAAAGAGGGGSSSSHPAAATVHDAGDAGGSSSASAAAGGAAPGEQPLFVCGTLNFAGAMGLVLKQSLWVCRL